MAEARTVEGAVLVRELVAESAEAQRVQTEIATDVKAYAEDRYDKKDSK